MNNNNNQFLKYLDEQETQILCDIDYLTEIRKERGIKNNEPS